MNPRLAAHVRTRRLIACSVACLALALSSAASAAPATARAPEGTTAVAAPGIAQAARAASRPAPARSDHVRPAHGTHHWTTSDRVVPTVTGPDDNLPIDIDTRLYVPDNASARHPQPAILMTHGFGGSKDSTEVLTTARFFAAHGYVVLTYTSSGFGASGGCVSLQSADYDVKSARQVIDKVLEPRRDVVHDRRGAVIGTIGGSYGGGIQLPLAAADRRIHTSIVGRSWNNLAYSLDPNNRVVPGDPTGLTHGLDQQGVFKQEWTSLFYALGHAQPVMGNGGCPQSKTGSGDPATVGGAAACPGYYLSLCEVYTGLVATGDTDATGRRLIRRASGATFLDRIHEPVLLVQGQSDTLFNENDASATYLALKRRHVPVGMIWNSGGHGGYNSAPGECEPYDGAQRSVREQDHCYLTLRNLGWMNHWLRGTKGGRGPAFTYYRDWVRYGGHGADDEQYAASARFPLRDSLRFTLSAPNVLARPGARPIRGTRTMINPAGGEPAAYSETSNFTGRDSSPSLAGVPPQEIPGQAADFQSREFSRPFDAVGIPSAHLRITNANGQDMVFFAKVYDVAPDHSATLIHRLIAPVRVPAGAVGTPVDLKLLGFAHRFAAHHRVRLVLCTTDQTSYNDKVADVITVRTGPGSTFTLPGHPAR